MYLIDTNIFLEILLKQDRSEECKKFLQSNIESLHISDFSLHSIGVILFRQKETSVFKSYIEDILPLIKLISLPKSVYPQLLEIKESIDLDFDDIYQYLICRTFSLKLITMDQDFKNVEGIDIQML
jgi:predicted nucleic acid-binding protein